MFSMSSYSTNAPTLLPYAYCSQEEAMEEHHLVELVIVLGVELVVWVVVELVVGIGFELVVMVLDPGNDEGDDE
ncbi:hypothetical protein ACFX1S_040890 [Malus domestica]